MDEYSARMALACVVEPATTEIAQAVVDYGPVMVWETLLASQGALARKAAALDLDRVRGIAERAGIRFNVPGCAEWVDALADLHRGEPVNQLSGVPFGLWLKGAGDLAELCGRSVSMVGSRAASAYGEHAASSLAADLGEGGVCVVSGGAYGIDAAAHRGCLSSRTPTVAVLAGGLDMSYPSSHEPLFRQIAESGVLVSELPPGEHPTRVRFLGRNRVIAALTQGTVIVEAAVRSGARNTLAWANSISRITMAVPGPVTNSRSFGPHQAIRNAEAVLVTNSGEVRELIGPLSRSAPTPKAEWRFTDGLSPAELRLYESIPGRGSRSVDELSLKAELPLGQCLGLLNQLADQGLVWQNPKREWQITSAKQREKLLAESL
ncbi:MAG: DNA-protecting protein DprA, partial [Propionibacteriaceae bacterium]|nr:DNA-protecting protein DprA [Propionibacteriaceae bacterium]